MSKQSILITGASTGIGRATATKLARDGYQVFAGVRKQKDADSMRNEGLENLIPVILDVTKTEDVDRVYTEISQQLGDGGLFGLINNAGMNYVKPFELADNTEVRRLMEVNVFAPIYISQKFLNLLQKYKQVTNRNSHLINIGSIGSVVGLPWEYIYHVSKFAIYGFSKSLKAEVDSLGIKVSCVMPGSINTDFFDKTADSIGENIKGLSGQNQDYYVAAMNKMNSMAGTFRSQGLKPEGVAKVISKVLKKENPRLKILVGTDAKVLNFIELFMPEFVMNFVVKKLLVPKI